MAAQVIAQEIVTLFIVIPILLFSLFLANKGYLKGKIMLTGILGYLLYMYATYCFVAVYNKFFLLYVLLMSLSFFGFILNMYQLVMLRKEIFFYKTSNKYIGFSSIILGLTILFMWLGKLVPPLIRGTVPSNLEHYTTFPIQALDMGIIVPVAIISGIAVIKEHVLGYLLIPVVTIKGVAMFFAIDAMLLSMFINNVPVSTSELIIFPCLTLLLCFNLYLIMTKLHDYKELL